MAEKPQTFQRDLAHLPAALQPLTEEKRWVGWKWAYVKDKWTKPPIMPRYPDRHARSNDPDTWTAYGDALAALAAGNSDGIGYMLLDSGVGALDLDHCVVNASTESLHLTNWAEQVCSKAGTAYREVTVSGTGLRVIGAAHGPTVHRKMTMDKNGGGLEIYRNCARSSRSVARSLAGHVPNCRRSTHISTA
jgi:primase-polymerase (primpol)-like protein